MVLYYGLIQCITASNCSLGAHWPTWAAVQLSASDARTSGRHCCAAPTPKPVVTFISVSFYLNQPSPRLTTYPTQSRSLLLYNSAEMLAGPPLWSSAIVCFTLHRIAHCGVINTQSGVWWERQGETATTRHQKAVFVYFSLLHFYFPFFKHLLRLCLLVLSSPHTLYPL